MRIVLFSVVAILPILAVIVAYMFRELFNGISSITKNQDAILKRMVIAEESLHSIGEMSGEYLTVSRLVDFSRELDLLLDRRFVARTDYESERKELTADFTELARRFNDLEEHAASPAGRSPAETSRTSRPFSEHRLAASKGAAVLQGRR